MLPVTRTASSTLSRLGSYLRLAAQTPVVMCSVAAALATHLNVTDSQSRRARGAGRRPSNKAILVTGATAGVGLATCKRLAARGARVLVCGRNAERTRRAVEAIGGRAEAMSLDLCSLESVRACAEKAKPLKLDVVVLNAGVNANVPTARHPELDCSLVFGVNRGHFHWLLCCWTLWRGRPRGLFGERYAPPQRRATPRPTRSRASWPRSYWRGLVTRRAREEGGRTP